MRSTLFGVDHGAQVCPHHVTDLQCSWMARTRLSAAKNSGPTRPPCRMAACEIKKKNRGRGGACHISGFGSGLPPPGKPGATLNSLACISSTPATVVSHPSEAHPCTSLCNYNAIPPKGPHHQTWPMWRPRPCRQPPPLPNPTVTPPALLNILRVHTHGHAFGCNSERISSLNISPPHPLVVIPLSTHLLGRQLVLDQKLLHQLPLGVQSGQLACGLVSIGQQP